MGKPKKTKKGQKEDEIDDEHVTTDLKALSLDDDDADDIAQMAKPKKNKKSKAAAAAAFLLADEEDEDDDEEEEEDIVVNKKTKVVSAFAMLDMDDDSDIESVPSDEEVKVEQVPKAANKKSKKQKKEEKKKVEDADDDDIDAIMAEIETKPKKDKKKKKKKEAEENDDDDIDALIAELDAKPEPSKKEKKKNKKKDDIDNQNAEDDDIDAVLAEIEGKPKATKKEKKKKKKEEQEDMNALINDIEAKTAQSSKTVDLDGLDLSSMTQDQIAAALGEDDDEEDERKAKKKKKKEKKVEDNVEEEEGEDEEDEGGTVKSAAQKKKEKRERQKQKKQEEKIKDKKKENKTEQKEESPEGAEKEDEADKKEEKEEDNEAEGKKKKKKDRKKKKEEKEEKEEKKKKPSKMALAIQEQQRKMREEEERIKQEEEEKERKILEAIREKEEKERLDREKREAAKLKKKEKVDRLKAEGKYMTPKQREAQRKAQQMLEAMKAQGLEVPVVGEDSGQKKKRVVYDRRKRKPQRQDSTEESSAVSPTAETPESELAPEIIEKEELKEETKEEKPAVAEEVEGDDVKDAWDAESEEEEEEVKEQLNGTHEIEISEKDLPKTEIKQVEKAESDDEEEEEEEEESGDDDDDDDDEDDSSSEEDTEESSSEDEQMTAQEKVRERALARIEKRRVEAEKIVSVDNLRCPVVCVLGHVDTGKTKILDKLRRTNVQDGEAGGITQQIGATNVPKEAIIDKTKMCKEFTKQTMKLPGLLIIDTPGHESFSNLRNRGSSLCDIAILVVDIMHGLEPQTIESMNLLKKKKCPFIVALNKIDRLYGWQSNPHTDIMNTLKKQKTNTKQEFDSRTKEIITQFAEQGFNATLFFENKNPKEYISLVPTSAHSGDGMGNMVALICELSQTYLAKKLAFSENLHATVMEVKAITGLGTTIDVILVNGRLHEGQTVVIPGTDGPIVTQIRGLLLPEPMKELRVKGQYIHIKEVIAAQGVKIIAKDLDNALAGLPLHVAYEPDEIEVYKEELSEALENVLNAIRVQEKGVFVQASTLGSLEALLTFLNDSKIPYSGINIGPVHRRDVMRASVMLERDAQYATILAFDVKIEREAQEFADKEGIRIFSADIIYHLFDHFTNYRAEYKKKKQDEFKHLAVFPCKLRVLPQFIFNSRDPIVMGVVVDCGFVKIGQPMCVPSKEFTNIGIVTSIEFNHKAIDKAVKGQEVCIKIESPPGDAPKMYGRHFDHTDLLYSKISRESIDVVKNYFREEMSKTDWQLILEMKKVFEII